MASSPRALILSVITVTAIICSVFSVTDARVCVGDADCLANNVDAECVSGTCKYMCHASFKDCDHNMDNGCESDTTTDEAHCGGCERRCPAPYNAVPSCEAGRCVITSGEGYFASGGRF